MDYNRLIIERDGHKLWTGPFEFQRPVWEGKLVGHELYAEALDARSYLTPTCGYMRCLTWEHQVVKRTEFDFKIEDLGPKSKQKHRHTHFTQEEIDMILRMLSEGATKTGLALALNVTRVTIHRISLEESYKPKIDPHWALSEQMREALGI